MHTHRYRVYSSLKTKHTYRCCRNQLASWGGRSQLSWIGAQAGFVLIELGKPACARSSQSPLLLFRIDSVPFAQTVNTPAEGRFSFSPHEQTSAACNTLMRRFLGFSAAVLCVYIVLFRGTWQSLQQPRPAQLADVAQLLAGQQRRRLAAAAARTLPASHGSSGPSVSGTVPQSATPSQDGGAAAAAAKPPLKRSPESHTPSAPLAATPPAFAGTAATVQVGAGLQLDFGPGLGVVRLHLRREWSPTSSAYASAVAEARLSASCAYRLEPGFLVQGSLMGGPGVTANRKNPRAPKVMERGEVGWAGGGKGPDYFIYMGSGPAGWLGIPHEGTIFAEVADEESMRVVTNVSLLPVPPVAPGVMHTLRRSTPTPKKTNPNPNPNPNPNTNTNPGPNPNPSHSPNPLPPPHPNPNPKANGWQESDRRRKRWRHQNAD